MSVATAMIKDTAEEGQAYVWNGEVCKFGTYKETGQLLWDYNFKAYCLRYKEEFQEEEFFFQSYIQDMNAYEKLQLVHSYIYQCCECSDWLTSEAYAIVQHIIMQLSYCLQDTREYNQGKWMI